MKRRKLNIAILTNEFYPRLGGIGTYTRELARAATTLGCAVTVFAPHYGPQAPTLRELDSTNSFRVERRRMGGIAGFPRLLKICREVIDDRRWDLVHAADLGFLESLAALNGPRHRACLATLYGSDVLRMQQMPHLMLRPHKLLERYRDLTTISNFTKNLVRRNFPDVSERRLRAVPPGLSDDWLKRAETDEPVNDIRRQLGLDPSRKIVLTVARLTRRKAQDVAILALTALPSKLRHEIQYVCVGAAEEHEPRYRALLEQMASQAQIPVHLPGILDDDSVAELWKDAAIALMPSRPHPRRVEGFGLSFLEAAAFGVPSVGTRLGGVPEAVLHGVTGLLSDPGDVRGLTAAVAELLTDQSLRNKLGNEAAKRARKFTWQRCAQRTYEPYL